MFRFFSSIAKYALFYLSLDSIKLANAQADTSCMAILCDMEHPIGTGNLEDPPERNLRHVQLPKIASKNSNKRKLADIVLDFEGVGNINAVGNFYSGLGVFFTENALSVVDSDAGGSGNFGGEPTPDTALFFLQGTGTFMNVPAGFSTGFSFWYTAINTAGSIAVYDDVNCVGTLLATLFLPQTIVNGAPDPTGQFSPFFEIEVSFSGVAKCVSFAGTENQIAFDNIQLGLISDDPPFFD